ncbi:MAG TPA: hypothetical protein PLU88_10485 [Armatimonadota bacterium]|nr:hypothetical protein [Armatimonadota bacterium]HPP75535.1 hypothetical protein [Armatimonadota bacterium]
MLFPKEKMQVITSYQGKTSDKGWLVLDFSRTDIEGLSKVYIDLEEVEKLQKKQNEQADVLKRTRDLLSLDDE